MKDRVLLLVLVAGCTPQAAPELEYCAEGTIATTDGCAEIPDRNPWAKDAGAAATVAPDAMMEEPDASVAEDAADPDAGEPWLDLRGAWAMRVVNVQLVTSEFLDPQAVTFTGLSIVRIDRALGVSSMPCALDSTPLSGTTTSWPPEAIAATTVQQESASADAIELGSRLTMTRTQLLGWSTSDPDAELPQEPDDPRVYDGDNDGNPGITLQISGEYNGEMYVASRSVLSIDGTITTADRIEGGCSTVQEQSILGASNDELAQGATHAQPIAALSSFDMVRAGEEIDCALLIQTADQLFIDP